MIERRSGVGRLTADRVRRRTRCITRASRDVPELSMATTLALSPTNSTRNAETIDCPKDERQLQWETTP